VLLDVEGYGKYQLQLWDQLQWQGLYGVFPNLFQWICAEIAAAEILDGLD
jgi:hypothetical protein